MTGEGTRRVKKHGLVTITAKHIPVHDNDSTKQLTIHPTMECLTIGIKLKTEDIFIHSAYLSHENNPKEVLENCKVMRGPQEET